MDKIFQAFAAINEKLWNWVETFIHALPNIVVALVVVLIFWALSQWAYSLVSRAFTKTQFNESLEHLLANTVKISVFVLGIIFALSVLQLQKTVFSLLAGVGVVGLALGFAFQDLAANFISGIMIATRAPMRLGDIIKIGDITGTVEDIRIRDTLLRNFSGQEIIIPNKNFMTETFKNYSSYGSRKITVDIGVSYDADLGRVKKVVLDAISDIDGVLSEPKPAVFVKSLGASAVDLVVYLWISYPGDDFLVVRDQAIIATKTALDENDMNLPFPTRTIEFSEPAKGVLRTFAANELGKG